MEPRIPALDPAELSGRQRELFDAIAGPRGGVVRGPFAIWLRHPDLVEKANDFGNLLREGTDVPRRLSELAILVTARSWSARYEWYAHAEQAAKAGIDRAIIEAIRTNGTPAIAGAAERAVYALTKELQEDKAISEETYRAAIDALGQDQVIDLVAIIGFYTMVAMTLNAFNAPLPDGAADPFA